MDIKVWEKTLARYKRIQEVVNELLLEGIGCDGSEELNIPICSFCSKYKCFECPFAQVFGECSKENSKWDLLWEKINEVDLMLEDYINAIDEHVKSLK